MMWNVHCLHFLSHVRTHKRVHIIKIIITADPAMYNTNVYQNQPLPSSCPIYKNLHPPQITVQGVLLHDIQHVVTSSPEQCSLLYLLALPPPSTWQPSRPAALHCSTRAPSSLCVVPTCSSCWRRPRQCPNSASTRCTPWPGRSPCSRCVSTCTRVHVY